MYESCHLIVIDMFIALLISCVHSVNQLEPHIVLAMYLILRDYRPRQTVGHKSDWGRCLGVAGV